MLNNEKIKCIVCEKIFFKNNELTWNNQYLCSEECKSDFINWAQEYTIVKV
ncbi:Uncharacterised protein [Mycoplasmopsis maculosa]|uniref:TRASH domain-containing protein n=1 Tax=Mycoplasmopsis maculosa TaxID=114885 RepID=A0A449B4R7_9BACT|nr:hypothetical protein [Mycoplasmopsis maculosa]VEU75603.1 Uncharacterised protein [Mycoplasmopsis maculosa]